MKILVLNPASKITKNVVKDVLYGCWCKGKRIGGATVPPFALLSVATVLKNSGFDVTFIDAQAEKRFINEISAEIYDVVIISTSTMSFSEDVQTLQYIKEQNHKIISVVFGSHPTFMPKYCLEEKAIDLVVKGEPEFIIRDVIKAIDKKSDSWKILNGIGFKKNGQYILNPGYAIIDNFDELPFLETSFLPKNVDYFNPIVKRMPYITTTTSNGCPGRCTYCTAPFFYGKKIRFKSLQNVVNEIKHYMSNGYKEVYFRDETFTFDKERTKKICDSIISERIDVTWICNARIGTVDKELMQLMKNAGCHLIKFGVESGVQEILDKVKKDIRIEDTIKTFKWAHEIAIDTHAHFMLGMPGETKKTIKQTIKFAKEINPTTVTFGICTPYPGTPLFNEIAAGHYEIYDGTSSNLSSLHTRSFFNEYFTELTSKELEDSIKRAYRSFYLRPLYIIKWLKRMKNINEIKKVVIAGANIIDFSIRGE